VRRHRLGVAVAVTTALLVVAGAAAIVVQARHVSQARTAAVQRQAQAEELIGFLLGDLHTRLSAIGGLDVLEKVGEAAQGYFEAVPEQDLSDQEVFRRSEALRQIGQIHVERGDFAGAMPLFRQSLSLASAIAARDSSSSEWQLGLGASHFWVGFIHWRQNELDSALVHFTPYLAITKITLQPHVTFGGEKQPSPEDLRTLHDQAHHGCFIANSVRCEVVIRPH
jgi:hypothetical protein